MFGCTEDAAERFVQGICGGLQHGHHAFEKVPCPKNLAAKKIKRCNLLWMETSLSRYQIGMGPSLLTHINAIFGRRNTRWPAIIGYLGCQGLTHSHTSEGGPIFRILFKGVRRPILKRDLLDPMLIFAGTTISKYSSSKCPTSGNLVRSAPRCSAKFRSYHCRSSADH